MGSPALARRSCARNGEGQGRSSQATRGKVRLMRMLFWDHGGATGGLQVRRVQYMWWYATAARGALFACLSLHHRVKSKWWEQVVAHLSSLPKPALSIAFGHGVNTPPLPFVGSSRLTSSVLHVTWSKLYIVHAAIGQPMVTKHATAYVMRVLVRRSQSHTTSESCICFRIRILCRRRIQTLFGDFDHPSYT
jgi:hypothetical protein